jgi:hypothetical protein
VRARLYDNAAERQSPEADFVMNDTGRQPIEPEPDEPRRPPPQPDPRRGAVLGLLIALLLVVIGLILVKVLGDAGRLQDCVMSGRTNCAPIETAPAQ